MSQVLPPRPDDEFTGKYEEAGRVGHWLLRRFYAAVEELLAPRLGSGAHVLEVGCGAGYSSQRLLQWLPKGTRYVGSDITASLLAQATARNPGTSFIQQSAYGLALPDKSVDAIVMLEVLEHLNEPDLALSELRRVARHTVIISTPREPIWRILNMSRGKYLRDFGNTPGHIQHWSTRGLRRFASSEFSIVDARTPLPWTLLALSPRS